MNTYEEQAVISGRNAMSIAHAKVLADLVDNDTLGNDERIAIQNALRLFASKTNQVLHVIDGGVMYIATSHDLKESTDTTRLTRY
jgi:hypothetical protein